jgi:hypothetical protein
MMGGACRSSTRGAAVPLSPAASAHEAFDLVGTVRDDISGRAVAHVMITVDKDSTMRAQSDLDGRYRIAAVPMGSHFVSARRIGYYLENREVDATCPVVIDDSAGRPLSDPEPCDAAVQVLNFHMREHALRLYGSTLVTPPSR